MKLLKKLAILTCALAAFSFVACDFGNSDDDEPNTPVVDAGSKTTTVAITADEAQVSEFEESVYAYLFHGYGDDAVKPFGEWPGKQLTKNTDLGIWYVTEDVSLFDDSLQYLVIFHNNNNDNDKRINAPAININKSNLYTRARTWIDWDGISADTTEAYVEPEAPELTESSTVLAIDISKVPKKDGKDGEDGEDGKGGYDTSSWAEVAVYVWGGSIGDDGWGTFPGAQLTKSKVNENIFYLVVDGKEGSGNLIFSNNNKGEQFDGAYAVLEAGKKYLVTDVGAEGFAEWEDFSLDKLI